jgi:hypothetical protein
MLTMRDDTGRRAGWESTGSLQTLAAESQGSIDGKKISSKVVVGRRGESGGRGKLNGNRKTLMLMVGGHKRRVSHDCARWREGSRATNAGGLLQGEAEKVGSYD